MRKIKLAFFILVSLYIISLINLAIAQDPYAPTPPVRCPAEFEPIQSVSLCSGPYFLDVTNPSDEPIRRTYVFTIKEIINAGADIVFTYTADNELDKDNLINYLTDPAIGNIPMEVINERIAWIYTHPEVSEIWVRDIMPQVVYFGNVKQIGLFATYSIWDIMVERFISHTQYESFQYMREPLPLHGMGFCNDGGNFMTDGFGTVIMTEFIYKLNEMKLPDPNQTEPGLSPETLEDIFTTYHGAPNAIVLDDVEHGSTPHIDMYMKFLDEETILYGTPPGTGPYANVRTNIENRVNYIRNNYTSAWGRPYKFIQIELPEIEPNGEYNSKQYRSPQTLFYTYINSLIVNNHILVPIYGRPEDAAALQVYRSAMPGYTVSPYDCLDPWPKMGGAIHCITHEINREGPVIPSEDIPTIPTDANIPAGVYDYFERFVSKGSITTEAGVSIEPGGFVIAKTDGTIYLEPGFTAKNGSFFRAHITN